MNMVFFIDPLNFSCGLPAPASCAITAFASNDTAATAPIIDRVVFIYMFAPPVFLLV